MISQIIKFSYFFDFSQKHLFYDFLNQWFYKLFDFSQKYLFYNFSKQWFHKYFGFSKKVIIFLNDTPKLVPNQFRHALSIWDNIRSSSRTFTEGLTYPISGLLLGLSPKVWHTQYPAAFSVTNRRVDIPSRAVVI